MERLFIKIFTFYLLLSADCFSCIKGYMRPSRHGLGPDAKGRSPLESLAFKMQPTASSVAFGSGEPSFGLELVFILLR